MNVMFILKRTLLTAIFEYTIKTSERWSLLAPFPGQNW